MTGVSNHDLKIIGGSGLSWRLGQFDINQFDSTQFDTDQGFQYTFKRPVRSFSIPLLFEGLSSDTYKVRRSPNSFKVPRNNPTSLSIIMELVN